MPARCERCGAEIEQVWEYHSSDGPEWLCQECHPKMTTPER
jgi:DNA-directed RNA polymerase subunit RPC12/RpoP